MRGELLFDAGRGCVCQALGWVLLCKHSCVSSCSCVLVCSGYFHTNILDCAFLYLHTDSHIMLITMCDLYMRLFFFLFRVYKRFLIASHKCCSIFHGNCTTWFPQDALMNMKFKRTHFFLSYKCFNVTFDHFNLSSLNIKYA